MPGTDDSLTSQDIKGSSRSRRAFKACVHCRSRKARCDLGDVDSPKDPPCARCRREGRECSFAPSRRGGRRIAKQQSKSESTDPKPTETKSHLIGAPDKERFPTIDRDEDEASPASLHSSSTAKRSPVDTRPRKRHRHDSLGPESLAAASLRNPVDAVNLLVLASEAAQKLDESDEESSDDEMMTDGEDSLHQNGTSPDGPKTNNDKSGASDSRLTVHQNQSIDESSPTSHTSGGRHNRSTSLANHVKEPPPLSTFPLVQQGVLTTEQLRFFVDIFFNRIHFLSPMVPHHRIPKTDDLLAKFAVDEPHLLLTFIVIASRYEKTSRIHERSWAYFRTCISDLMLGKPASIGSVEALLLLSEYLPRSADNPNGEDHEEETRMAWMLVGMAVRLGYMLGLDQKTFVIPKPVNVGEPIPEELEVLHRERLAWTYCYLFDRQISIRTGKAFWSRGPGLCFPSNTTDSIQSSYDNFPLLRPIPGVQDDFASLVQAYVELTQAIGNAHDILYPSKDRTIALVRVGEYQKYLDAFTRSINGFRLAWETKRWNTFPLAECVWISFHYLRLYISSFALQAHVQRAMPMTTQNKKDADVPSVNGTDGKKSFDSLIFPRGPMGSPDGRFIQEGIEAAIELLKLCTDRLYPGGALPYLPWRFFLYFSYAGVFLLKALFIGAVVPPDQRPTVHLLKRLILCLACGSSDDQHPGVRYARLLNGLLMIFSRGADGVDTQGHVTPRTGLKSRGVEKRTAAGDGNTGAWPLSAAPSRQPSPPPEVANGTQNQADPKSSEKPRESQEDVIRSLLASPAKEKDVNMTTTNGNTSGSQFSNPVIQYDPLLLQHTSYPIPQSAPQFGASSTGNLFSDHLSSDLENHNTLFGPFMAPLMTGDSSTPNVQSSANTSFDFDFDLNPPRSAPEAFSQLLSNHQALDGEFWRSLGFNGTEGGVTDYSGYNPTTTSSQATGSTNMGGTWPMGTFNFSGMSWST
ncbi:hypothetical protein FRC02_010838 [Tulasnella sp. 418]|nr:hypothetical protein FRC02_010838 [Tulasnella sp. 418]